MLKRRLKKALPISVCVLPGLAMLLGFLLASCGAGPGHYGNRLVVHVIAPTCESDHNLEPILIVEKVSGGFGKTTLTEWRRLERQNDCIEPHFTDYSWEGKVLQVWATESLYSEGGTVRLQFGYRVDDASIWAIPAGTRMRIDYSHIFLGTFDVGSESTEFIPANALESIRVTLEDRQECAEGLFSKCGTDWKQADLATFVTIPQIQHDSSDNTNKAFLLRVP